MGSIFKSLAGHIGLARLVFCIPDLVIILNTSRKIMHQNAQHFLPLLLVHLLSETYPT